MRLLWQSLSRKGNNMKEFESIEWQDKNYGGR